MRDNDVVEAIASGLLTYLRENTRVFITADSMVRLVERLRDSYQGLRGEGYEAEAILKHWGDQAPSFRANVLEFSETITLADGGSFSLITETVTGRALDLCPDDPP